MKIIKVNKNNDQGRIGLIADYLNHGKVIVYPSDTIYGIGCLANNKKAIEKILKFKKRSKKKGLIILVSSIAMAKRYCLINKKQAEKLKEIWQNRRPTTVILNSKNVLPKELEGDFVSLAIRLPKNKFLTKIIKIVNLPLISTSLNLSGEQPLTNIGKVKEKLNIRLIDLIIDGGVINDRKPSKIVDIRDSGSIKILRK